MKLILFEFQCTQCDTITEDLVHSDIFSIACANCAGEARRIASAARIDWQAFVHGTTASEPAIDKWAKMRQKKMEIEQRKLRDHGTYD